MGDCVSATLLSLPMVLMISRFAGWEINLLQLLCLTAMYVASSMAIHVCSWHLIAQAAHRKEDEEVVHDGDEDP